MSNREHLQGMGPRLARLPQDYLDAAHVRLMLLLIQDGGQQKDLAKALGVSPSYLSDVMNGRREPGPMILSRLGLRRQVVYRPTGGGE